MANDIDKTTVNNNKCLTSSSFGQTLLPKPAAALISVATRSASASVRLGSRISGLALDGARISALTGLELSRAAIETILARAGRDVSQRSHGSLGKAEAEGLLEKSVLALHLSITSLSFFVSTGFHTSTVAISSASSLCERLLSGLDSTLGSTETSRAIAAIVLLIRREFQNPESTLGDERVSTSDLFTGFICFGLLQLWCRKYTERQFWSRHGEDMIWDVVVLSNGARADVVGYQLSPHSPPRARGHCRDRPSSFVSATGNNEEFEAIPRNSSTAIDLPEKIETPDNHSWMSEAEIKDYIIRQLPDTAHVSLSSEVVTTKTVTVKVSGADTANISPPPGAAVVEHSVDRENVQPDSLPQTTIPKHKLVFRTTLKTLHSANIREIDPSFDTTPKHPELLCTVSQPDSTMEQSVNTHDSQPYIDIERNSKLASSDSESRTASKSQIILSPERNTANQKKHRKPAHTTSSRSEMGSRKSSLSKIAHKVKPNFERPDKRYSSTKEAKRSTSTNRQGSRKRPESTSISNGKLQVAGRVQRRIQASAQRVRSSASSLSLPKSQLESSIFDKELPAAPKQGSPNYFSSNDLKSTSRTSLYSVHERRRDSLVSQTDTYSVHSLEYRPPSPNQTKTHMRTSGSLSRTRPGVENTRASEERPTTLEVPSRKRRASIAPSIYTIAANHSVNSLMLATLTKQAGMHDDNLLLSLQRDGTIPGMFPRMHFVRNVQRFIRFSSASYGENFLRLMGLTQTTEQIPSNAIPMPHSEHRSFSEYTGLPSSTILLSSFVDPQGGSNAAGETDTNVPLVHYVSLDHASKAVVLTCRGTLGFDDVLTDMMCDYTNIQWRGSEYTVHKGMHASARRLLEGRGGRVMATIKAALEEFTDYGLVLCGHSLGGGVAALLAILISEPDPQGDGFITAYSRTNPLALTFGDAHEETEVPGRFHLPPGRPIHVFAYGPPASISPLLRQASRGLITTIINGEDIVPSLSLGTLRDMLAVSLAFKSDDSGAKSQVKNRVWDGILSSFTNRFYVQPVSSFGSSRFEDDQWAWSALKTLRASMLSAKLVPPGEVFIVETTPVLQREAFTPRVSAEGIPNLGRPATRVKLKLIRDVESRFGEIRFGSGMFGDHSPGRYEANLKALRAGVGDY